MNAWTVSVTGTTVWERLDGEKDLLLHNFWTRKLVREMDGLDLVSVVGDVMHHLQQCLKNKQWRPEMAFKENLLIHLFFFSQKYYVGEISRWRLYLVVHHPICDLAHLAQNSQGVRKAILGPRLRLIPAELTLQTPKERYGTSKIKSRLYKHGKTSRGYSPSPASPSEASPWPSWCRRQTQKCPCPPQ